MMVSYQKKGNLTTVRQTGTMASGDNMDIEILQLLSGARQARGTVVIIDVFRAFTMESYAFGSGASRIYPVGDRSKPRRCKKEDPSVLLAGERAGSNSRDLTLEISPFEVQQADLRGRTLVHTTSAGTRGWRSRHSANADELLLGALVNARATAEYILSRAPQRVSLVAMGLAGETPTTEDNLCADYLKALLEKRPFDSGVDLVQYLRDTDGGDFCAESQGQAPEEDFWLSVLLRPLSFRAARAA